MVEATAAGAFNFEGEEEPERLAVPRNRDKIKR
jgi:hypothetical protein